MMHSALPSRIARLLALLALLALPFAAAQDEEQQQDQQDQQTQERTALRVAHLAPDGPTVDVMVNGERLVEGLAPNTVSGYLFLPPGDVELEVVSAAAAAPADEPPPEEAPPEEAPQDGVEDPGAVDQPADAPEGGVAGEPQQDMAAEDAEPLLTQSVTLDPDTYATLTLAASSEQAEEDAETDRYRFEARLITDTFQNLPGAGRALVRVVHAAPAADQVTVVATRAQTEEERQQTQEQQEQQPEEEQPEGEQQEGPPQIEGEPLASGVAFGDGGEYVEVRSGSHHVQVQTQAGEVAVDLEDLQFESGVIYTLFIASTQDGENVVLTPAVDGGVRAQGR